MTQASGSKTGLFDAFLVEMRRDPDFMRAVGWFTWTNLYETAVISRNTRSTGRPSPSPTHQTKREETSVAVRADADIIKSEILVLSLMMLNGKMLGDCTFGEVRGLAHQFARLGASRPAG